MNQTSIQNDKTDARAARQGDARLRNIRSFEGRMDALRADFPGLRHERTGSRIEWFVRASRPLAAEDLDIRGELVIDAPCSEDTARILDAMAYADDPALGRDALAREFREEVADLAGWLDRALDFLHGIARREAAAAGRRRNAYLAGLSRQLAGKAIDLFPSWSEDKGRQYNPGQHVRDRVKAASGEALKAMSAAKAVREPAEERRAPGGGAKRPRGRGKGRGQEIAAAPRRPGRPFRLPRYSRLYD